MVNKVLRKKADLQVEITAIFKQRPLSDLSGKLVINEIFPFGESDQESSDWVEFYNNSDRSILLEGMLFKDSKHSYQITSRKKLAAGEYVVLTNNDASSVFQDVKQRYIEVFPFGLSSQGEHLSIWDKKGMLVDSLHYTSTVKDTLLSFSLRHPELANEDANSWDLTVLTSPGLINEKWRSELDAAARAAEEKKRKSYFTLLNHVPHDELIKIVQSLSLAYRTVFNMYVLDGYKHREIADYLGISQGTSKWHVSDARKKLKGMLATQYKIENKPIELGK